MAGRLAIARPGGAWVLGIHARARGGHRARLRERSAPELTERVTEGPLRERSAPELAERVTEGPALGTAAHLPRPLARLKHEGGVGRCQRSPIESHSGSPIQSQCDSVTGYRT